MKRYDIGIIGAGASGMMAAITAAKEGMKVTLFERNDRVGKKILMTGNGKCNLSNQHMDAEMYYADDTKRVMECIQKFDVEDTVSFFGELGVLIKEKNGYLYPFCEQASVVLDALRYELKALGVSVITDCKIVDVQKRKQDFRVTSEDNKTFRFDRVILANGGMAAPRTGSDGNGFDMAKRFGHTIRPVVPALVQLRCKEDFMKSISGVRSEGIVRVWNGDNCVAEEYGEIQFTDYGISGIPVFQLSRIVNYLLKERKEVKVTLDLLPGVDGEALEHLVLTRHLLHRERVAEELFNGLLNKKIMSLFLKLSGIKATTEGEEISEADFLKVYELCKEFTVHITGSNPFDNAQVSAGGISMDEVMDTMESGLVPGLFFAGEILDVDGKCGGYNLQWAWSSGYLAGKNASLWKE